MPDKEQDWLECSLRTSREELQSLPAPKQTALDNDAKFRSAVRSIENGLSEPSSDG